MVAIQSRLDDVLLSTKGKKVEADHQVTRSIPSICSETGKTRRITLDVSPEGERELAKLDKKYKDLLLEAGRVYEKLAETRIEARAAKPRRKSKQNSKREQETSDAQQGSPTERQDREGDDAAEQNATPAGSNLGSNNNFR